MPRTLNDWTRAVRKAALDMEEDMQDVLVPHLRDRIDNLQQALGKSIAREVELEAKLEEAQKDAEAWRVSSEQLAGWHRTQSETLDELYDERRSMRDALEKLHKELMRTHRIEMARTENRLSEALKAFLTRLPT